MSLDAAAIERIARELGIGDEEIAARKAYLEFSADDAARLKTLHQPLAAVRAEIINEFYAHLLSFEETSARLGDESALLRLKQAHSLYFDQLTEGRYDAGYVRDRIRVGAAHHRIGLEPKWYLGAYCKYLGLLIPQLKEAAAGESRIPLQTTLSLLKLVFLDIGLAIDTYINDREKRITQKAAQLAALNHVAATITSSLSIREVLDEVMRCAVEFTGARASCLAFFDHAAGEFRDWVTRGLSERFRRNMTFRRGGLAAEAFATGNYVLSSDAPAARHRLSALAREEGIRCFVCLPLIFQQEQLGVLYMYRDDRDDFHADEIDLLKTFAHLAAGAICNARLYAKMTDLAQVDGLTGVLNRRSFDEQLALEVERAKRYGKRFSLLLLDVDHFKRINDAHGHPAGDAVLKFLAGVLRGAARNRGDVVARFGGEEFVILLPDTERGSALAVAERIRRQIERSAIEIPHQTSIGITASIGISCHPECADSAAALIAGADQALYAAKRAGRNCTKAFGESTAAAP